MKQRIRPILFCFLLLVSLRGIAQVDTIRVGDHQLLTTRLRPGLTQYLIYMQDPAHKTELGFWYWLRDISVETINGSPSIVISQHWYGSDSTTYREIRSVNKADDFSPVFHKETSLGKTRAYNWGKEKITGADTVAGNTINDFTLNFKAPNYNWNLDVETFEMLPLSEGKAFAIYFYDAGIDTPQYAVYKVTGSEVLKTLDNQEADCWKLVTEGQYNTSRYSETYWISKKTHEFLKEEDHYGKFFRLKIRMPVCSPDLLQLFSAS